MWLQHTIYTLENQIRIMCLISFLQKNQLRYTRTYGSDLLGVYDIPNPICNCLEDIILQIFPYFVKNCIRLPSKITYDEVSAHSPMKAFKHYNPQSQSDAYRSCQSGMWLQHTYRMLEHTVCGRTFSWSSEIDHLAS